MKTIRQVGEYILYYEPLQRMYRIADDEDVSLWFDKYEKDELMELTDEEFVEECREKLSIANEL